MSGRKRIILPEDQMFNYRPLQIATHSLWAKSIDDMDEMRQCLRDVIQTNRQRVWAPTNLLPGMIHSIGVANVALNMHAVDVNMIQSYEVKLSVGYDSDAIHFNRLNSMSVSDYATESAVNPAIDYVVACTLTSFVGVLPYSHTFMPFGEHALFPTRAALVAFCTKYEIGIDLG